MHTQIREALRLTRLLACMADVTCKILVTLTLTLFTYNRFLLRTTSEYCDLVSDLIQWK